MKLFLMLFFLVGSAALTLSACETTHFDARDKSKEGMVCHTAVVTGMMCEACAQTVTANLIKQAGVQSADIDVAAGQVKIYTAPDAVLSKDTVNGVIDKSGYKLESFKMGCKD